MSRLFGCFVPNAVPVAPLLQVAGDQTRITAAQNAHGYGLGFVQGGQILLQRRPQIRDQDIDLTAACADVRSPALIIQVRGDVDGVPKVQNTAPYRFGPWMYAQLGALPTSPELQESVRNQLPDSLRRNIQGETDAELLFHLVLSRLRDTGISPLTWAVEPDRLAAPIVGALATWRYAARQAGLEPRLPIAVLLGSARSFFALSLGAPLGYTPLRRISPDTYAPAGDDEARADACLFLATGADRALGDGELATIDAEMNISLQKL